jgi:NADP-dependent 3-hydroxy acid dehydrogenase YdfG
MGRLNGRTAWITGGGTGIGAATAEALAEAGADIVVSGIEQAPLNAVVASITEKGGTARAIQLDTTDADQVLQAADEIGKVDIMMASAGINVPKRALASVSLEDWDKVVKVNLNGVYYAVRAVLPGMRERGDGLLILMSSWAGRYAISMTASAYNASKRAVIALSETINAEEGGNGIRSTVVMPGEVATTILKTRADPPDEEQLARMLKPEDLAKTLRFVAELPAHACVNELMISPTWNRFYRGW